MKTNSGHLASREIKPRIFKATIEVPTSKSVANRLLILAAVHPDEWVLHGVPDSSDVVTMVECLQRIGMIIRKVKDELHILNTFPACEKIQQEPIILQTGDGGTTNRFLAALLARGKNTYHLVPSHKMGERPMEELMDAFEASGVFSKREKDGTLVIKGPYKLASTLQVDCSRSTQFATALALALSDTKTVVLPTKMENSEKYFTMTKTLIERARKGITDYYVNADGSGVGYPLALAAFGGEVTLSNVHEIDPDQADFAIVELLKNMKANIEWTKTGLKLVGNQKLKAFEANAAIYPDLMLTLAFLASYCYGTSTFSNLDVLRHKESDRLQEMLSMLTLFKVDHRYEKQEDKLYITGPALKAPSLEITPPVDHRVVMVYYLFLRKNSGGTLDNCHAVEKSFPRFFPIMGEKRNKNI